LNKILKRIVKHAIWLLIGGHRRRLDLLLRRRADAVLATFVTGRRRAGRLFTIAVLTATTYLRRLMREQVCTYMCPWPRIQGAMLDENSLVVTYNDWRGEPRSRHAKKAIAAGLPVGDCIDCNACVASAPWASTSAMASSSNASPARCASTPATASWTRSASRAA
jgi:polyferredoxin